MAHLFNLVQQHVPLTEFGLVDQLFCSALIKLFLFWGEWQKP
jgi:hypothetical protein